MMLKELLVCVVKKFFTYRSLTLIFLIRDKDIRRSYEHRWCDEETKRIILQYTTKFTNTFEISNYEKFFRIVDTLCGIKKQTQINSLVVE